MKFFLSIIMLFSLLYAIQVQTYEEKETAAVGSRHFDIKIEYDCQKTLTFEVRDKATDTPISGATVFVFYEERYSSLLGSGKTNNEGIYTYTLIGNPKNMKNLFLATFEKSGIKTKEIHFYLPRICFEEQQEPDVLIIQNKTEKNESGQIINQTEKKNDEIKPQKNQTEEKKEENKTQEYKETVKKTEGQPSICCTSGMLPVFAFLFIAAEKINQSRRNSSRT